MKNKTVISQQVYESLKRDIIHQVLKSGTPLLEEELAAKYQTSRTPIREALKRLESDGLISVYPYKGCFVRILTRRDINDIFEMRIALECMCCRTVMERGQITDELVRMLEEKMNEAKKAYQTGDMELAKKNGGLIHSTFIDLMGNPRIAKELSQLHVERVYMSNIVSLYKSVTPESIYEHCAIVNAMKEHNARLTEELLRAHLQRSQKTVLENLAGYLPD